MTTVHRSVLKQAAYSNVSIRLTGQLHYSSESCKSIIKLEINIQHIVFTVLISNSWVNLPTPVAVIANSCQLVAPSTEN